ncbi:MAG: hypothetical protein OEN50_19155 [Deltaproteobacteria bacterium]|nr:hypothetical protein [Deltaproteobacteria bacterium]
MPLRVPNLDDRTYDDLVEEAIAMLPRYAPAWTNHNPSDPGITLIELLAYFTELFIYRLNRLTKETKIKFLQLLRGSEEFDNARWSQASLEEIDEALRQSVRELRRPQRAVTLEDYEYLAREATKENPPTQRVLRARPFGQVNLQTTEESARQADAQGHVSLVLLSESESSQDAVNALLARVRDYLEPRRLLTTKLHVVEPIYLWIVLGGKIRLRPDASTELREKVLEGAITALRDYFSPWLGGPQKHGWPFGRALYLSEVYEVLEQVKGVDYVEDLHAVRMSVGSEPGDERSNIGIQIRRSRIGVDSRLGAEPVPGVDRYLRDTAGKLVAIALRPYELIRIASRAEDFSSAGASGADGPNGDQSGVQT